MTKPTYICTLKSFSNAYLSTSFVSLNTGSSLCVHSYSPGSVLAYFSDDPKKKEIDCFYNNMYSSYASTAAATTVDPLKERLLCTQLKHWYGIVSKYFEYCLDSEKHKEFVAKVTDIANTLDKYKSLFSNGYLNLFTVGKTKHYISIGPQEVCNAAKEIFQLQEEYNEKIKTLNDWMQKTVNTKDSTALLQYQRPQSYNLNVSKSCFILPKFEIGTKFVKLLKWVQNNPQEVSESFVSLQDKMTDTDGLFIVFCESTTSEQSGFLNKNTFYAPINEAELFYDTSRAKRSLGARGAGKLNWSIWKASLKINEKLESKSADAPSGVVQKIIVKQEKLALEDFFKTQHYENMNKKMQEYEAILRANNLLPKEAAPAVVKKSKI